MKNNTSTLHIASSGNLEIALSEKGATLRSCRFDGKECTLGYADEEGWNRNPYYFSATVGRFANRIANGKTYIDTAEITLTPNDGKNHLHSAEAGVHAHVWETKPFSAPILIDKQKHQANGFHFSTSSKDGSAGYPGNLKIDTYVYLCEGDWLVFDYYAKTDRSTLCNLTNHTYWNLDGVNGPIHNQILKMNAPYWLPVIAGIPFGEPVVIAGSSFDFSKPVKLGTVLSSPTVEPDPVYGTKGVDHCFIVDPDGPKLTFSFDDSLRNPGSSTLRLASVLQGNAGIMEVWTSLPGVQLYTANYLKGEAGRDGALRPNHGVCLETQFFPDAPNQADRYKQLGRSMGYSETEIESWNGILKPNQTFHQVTAHRFLKNK